MTLFVKTTADKYRLPIAVADSKKELAEQLGVSLNVVKTSYSRHISTYYVVEVDEDADGSGDR